jgi:spore germination protein
MKSNYKNRIGQCCKAQLPRIIIGLLLSMPTLLSACQKKDIVPPPAKVDPPKSSGIEIAGWYNDGWEQASHAVYLNNASLFSELNPCWYNLGTSDAAPGKNATDGSVYERSYAYSPSEIKDIHGRGDLIIPTLADNATNQINIILNTPASRAALIANLVNIAVSRGYDGWDLDFEYGDAADKGKFTSFANDLVDALKAKKNTLKLEVTIGAFEDAIAESNWLYDLEGLKNSRVDKIKIMAYDQNLGRNGKAGSVGDIMWVNKCLNYMIKQRGLPANKVLLGIPNYSHIYKKNSSGQYEHVDGFYNYEYIMARPGVQTIFNTVSQESEATWSDGTGSYKAYYCDAKSVAARLELVNTYALKGACFWVLGHEDPAIYPALKAKFPESR